MPLKGREKGRGMEGECPLEFSFPPNKVSHTPSTSKLLVFSERDYGL